MIYLSYFSPNDKIFMMNAKFLLMKSIIFENVEKFNETLGFMANFYVLDFKTCFSQIV